MISSTVLVSKNPSSAVSQKRFSQVDLNKLSGVEVLFKALVTQAIFAPNITINVKILRYFDNS
jgi:hypothetical protein